jgi:hypothetical protein
MITVIPKKNTYFKVEVIRWAVTIIASISINSTVANIRSETTMTKYVPRFRHNVCFFRTRTIAGSNRKNVAEVEVRRFFVRSHIRFSAKIRILTVGDPLK